MLENREQLEQVLRGRLGAAFARHAYGMRRWVDVFSARIPDIEDPYLTEFVAGVVHQNARHMVLFRERASAHGVNPDLYECPPEGEAIYEQMAPLDGEDMLAYALGSLEHFADLLAVYAAVAELSDDATAIAEVRADNDRAIRRLRELVSASGDAVAVAHELYRVRELAEAPLYASRR
jgi:PAS domain-containing protein